MRAASVLLVAGLGPSYLNQDALVGSSLAPSPPAAAYDLSRLIVRGRGFSYPLIRPRDDPFLIANTASDRDSFDFLRKYSTHPHLTSSTLCSILAAAGIDLEFYPIERIWHGGPKESVGSYDLVLLSTTFIWDSRTLSRAIHWLADRWPEAVIILGGQYSNLKYREILSSHASVRFIVRGDAEAALPRLLTELRGDLDFGKVPNLAWRDPLTGVIRTTGLEYIDLNRQPSPSFAGALPVVPYESMRGCPFACKYCSFPAASPVWRYKSAAKVAADFRRYREENGAQYIKALDSTFTVPPTRLRALLPLLAATEMRWEAYARANAIRSKKQIADLERAHCSELAIGFESMSDRTLGFMRKQVRATANRAAFELLRDSEIDYRGSFIVGYPGETPELFQATRDFLVNEYDGYFGLYLFQFKDETMPVWQDAHRFKVVVQGDDPDEGWSHVGMDLATARQLLRDTLRAVRWQNESAICRIWQSQYAQPLAPTRSLRDNTRIEKLVDRLAMASADFTNAQLIAKKQAEALAELQGYDIVAQDDRSSRAP